MVGQKAPACVLEVTASIQADGLVRMDIRQEFREGELLVLLRPSILPQRKSTADLQS